MAYSEKQLRAHRQTMALGEATEVLLHTHDQQSAPGTIRVLRLSPEARATRARTWLLVFLALAPPSVVCPPHLLWPLVMITVGVAGYFLRRGRAEMVLGGEARCPACLAFQLLEPGNAEFPMAHFCSECRCRSLVTPRSADAAAADG